MENYGRPDHGDMSGHDGDETNGEDDVTAGGESYWTGADGTYLSAEDNSVPDALLLNLYCAKAKAPLETEDSLAEADESWNPVRDWLNSHSPEEVQAAVEQRGENGLTALHFACRNVPPLDVIDSFLNFASDTAQLPDGFGWLPIHYACASGSDEAVIKALAEQYPDSKTATDGRGRTPLHFALGDKPATPDVVFLLSSTGAASFPDDIGMLPLHYACAFGASEEVLYVLTDAYPDAIISRDKRQRTPLHFALSNAGRKTVPAAVRLLLSLDRSIVNSIEGGPLPLSVLAAFAATVRNEEENRDKREPVHRCLEHLLNAEPDPTADFFTALQSLPDWLSERAVVMPVVQILLNEKISQRFPAAVLMMDFYVLTMVIISYSLNVVTSIERRFDDIDGNEAIETRLLIPMYAGAAYFTLREVVQIISFLSLKVFKLWLYDASNYLNVAFVALVLAWTIVMDQGSVDRDTFRVGAAISVILLWVKLLAYLRQMLIDFAVFVGGVFYVVQRLAAFLMALGVILCAFAQMFFTVFQQTEYCTDQPINDIPFEVVLEMTRCDASPLRPYCGFWSSFLNVYTMLLGEVDENDFETSAVATVLFILFMFLVVILLANVLIAIVTDSYKVIQDQRAAIVFWTNRLDFVAEMDAISNGPWKKRMKQALGMTGDSNGKKPGDFGKELWKQLMDLFVDDAYEGVMTVDFAAYTVLRIVACIFIIPLWIILGIVTVGWFWPPQIREFIFTSSVFKYSSDSEKEDELRRTQVKKLQSDVTEMRDELLQELALDRTQVLQMKSQVAEGKTAIAAEMRHVKRLVTMLFERQAPFGSR